MNKLLADLVAIPGPCGFEHQMIRYLYNRMLPIADECRIDGIGNLIVTKKGAYDGPSLIVSAHTDEVGFIVKKIEPNGLIRFEKLGGHDDRILLSEPVIVHTEQGALPGVIGTISCHMLKIDNPELVRKFSELYIDVGAADADEVAQMGIRVGDPITWATPYREMGANRAYGHGFDDKCGCAVLVKALEELDFSKVHGTVYGVFSVQEEVGLRGAKVAGQQLDADVALAVDTTAVSDTFEAMMDDTLELGRGPGVKVMDFSLTASLAVRKKLESVARSYGIPYQLEVFAGIGTDAGELHMAKSGIPSSVISVPSRYAHSSVETIDLRDFYYSKELLKAFIMEMRTKEEFSFLYNM